MKLLQYLQALLTLWVIYFLVIGMIVLFALFIGAPVVVLITKGKLIFPPPLDLLYRAIWFVCFASIFTGTVVWIKEVIFRNHD